METSELLLRVFIGFVVLFCLTRIMGRKEISQITFFNFVSAIAIGSIAASLVTINNFKIIHGVLALIGWSVFTLAMDFIDLKSKKARKITTGDPIIVIKEGKIVESALQKSRLDLDSLNAMLRQKDIFSVKDVDYAIFETNGKISVMKTVDKQSVTKSDLNITSKQTSFPISTEIIADGILVTKNLKKLNLDRTWVDQKLSQSGISSIEDVFYAEVQQDGTLYIDRKDTHLQ